MLLGGLLYCFRFQVLALLCGYYEGIDAVDGECKKDPEQRRHEKAAYDGANGMKVEVLVRGSLGRPCWLSRAFFSADQAGCPCTQLHF